MISNLDIIKRYLVIEMFEKEYNEKGRNGNGMKHRCMNKMGHNGMHSKGNKKGMHGFGLKYLIPNMASDREITSVDIINKISERSGRKYVSPDVIYPVLEKLQIYLPERKPLSLLYV